MKKIISLFAVFLLSLSLGAFAAENLSSLHASKGAASASSKSSPATASATQIYVANHSSQPFTVRVVGTTINDILMPGEIETVSSDIYFSSVRIQLIDRYGVIFFDNYVANYTTLNIYDYANSMKAKGGEQKSSFRVTQS
jgi:hypothetical protein